MGHQMVAGPTFSGLEEALPAPGAIYVRWNPATGGQGTVTYNVYTGSGDNGVDYSRPVASVESPDWVLTGLRPGTPVTVAVRAADSRGEDRNTRTIRVVPTNAYPEEEWRAAWVTRFEWASGTRDQIEQRLNTIFSTLSDAGLNAVVFQVRGQGDTLYPSPREPWSPMMSESARGSDPVKYAIERARENNVEFHAWMNLSTIWQSGPKNPPTDRNHPFFRMADASSPRTSQGLVHDRQGRPVQWGKDGYVWLTHGNPRVNTYLRQQVRYFIETYDVQGLHWDDRTGNPNGVSRDPVSVARFNGMGNPMRMEDFEAWQLDQLTRFLSDVYTMAKAKNPRLLISASPFGIADRTRIPGYNRYSDCKQFGVEPERWIQLGVLDVLMPQIYWAMPDPGPHFGTLVRDWVSHNRSGRPIWPGSNLREFGSAQPLDPVQVRYVALSRALGLNGNQFYSWSAARPEQWRAAGPKLYPRPARVPVPDHMRPGQTGQVMGTVSDSDGRPVVDCWIRIEGRDYTYLSCADGFYGIPNLRPGEYRIQFARTRGNVTTRPVTVVADRTVTLDVSVE